MPTPLFYTIYMSLINSKIFRAYDIRGIYPKEITKDFALRLGCFLPEFLLKSGINRKNKRKILIGFDFRPSSAILRNFLIKGLAANQVTVIDAGLVSTPMFYFLVKKTGADLGIMITASHLARNYNGFKICTSDLQIIPSEKFRKYLYLFKKEIPPLNKLVKIYRKNFLNDYVDFLLKKIRFSKKELKYLKKMKIIADADSKVVGDILKKISAKTGLKIKINSGNSRLKADMKLVFDGDGDRAVFVSPKGREILGDAIGVLLADYELKFNAKKIIIVDERSTALISEIVKKSRGKIIYSRVGHRFFKEKMLKYCALLGIEKSGHYYWRDFFFADSGVFTFLKVLKILAYYKKDLMDLMKDYRKYATLPEKNFKIKNYPKKLRAVEKKFKKSARRISHLDGLTMEFKDWRFNLRPSQTESHLRLNIESDYPEILAKHLAEIKKLIHKIK